MPVTLPNMALQQPTVGADDDAWGTYWNANASLMDAHRHIPGEGRPVPIAGLRADADWPFTYAAAYYAITSLKAIDFQPQAPGGVAGYSSALFANSSDGNNLYYRNSAGVNVRLTNGSALDTSSSGGIVGDYAAAGAAVTYSDADDAYTFREAAGLAQPWSLVSCGSVDIHEDGAFTGNNRVRLSSPAALAASYALTLPAALPGSTQLLQVSSAGAITASNTLATNGHLTLQGTGDLKHGDRSFCQDALGGVAISGSYSPIEISNAIGVELAATGVAYVPVYRLRAGDRLKSIKLVADSTAEPVLEIYSQSAGVATVRAHTASGTIVANGERTLTLNTPYTLGQDHMWLKVTAGGADLIELRQLVVTFDHP